MDVFPEVLYELFQSMPRQGPGSNEYTRKAYAFLNNLPQEPRLMDIGCGTGIQTLELARISSGKVIALDNYRPFLEGLKERARHEEWQENIEAVHGTMFELPFDKGTFDILWAEGAIFVIGFEKGLREWKPLIKEGGYLAVSELAWIEGNVPEEIRAYLESEYPEIKTDAENRELIRREGYDETGSFILPESCWREGFYTPMQERIAALKDKYGGNRETIEVLDAMGTEIDMYRKYSRYYGYVFYIMQSIVSS